MTTGVQLDVVMLVLPVIVRVAPRARLRWSHVAPTPPMILPPHGATDARKRPPGEPGQELLESKLGQSKPDQATSCTTTSSRPSCRGDELFPGIIGYDDTVIPEMSNALLAGHDMLFLGEKGQAKSRLMCLLVAVFSTSAVPYHRHARCCPVHEDPVPTDHTAGYATSSRQAPEPATFRSRGGTRDESLRRASGAGDEVRGHHRRAGPGEAGVRARACRRRKRCTSGSFPRMHRGIFAMNELPDLDELVQVGLFNILEERDVQIRGLPDLVRHRRPDPVLGEPVHVQPLGQGHPAAQGPHRHDVQTHYPRTRELGIEIMRQEAAVELDGEYPVLVPPFMEEIVEQMSIVGA